MGQGAEYELGGVEGYVVNGNEGNRSATGAHGCAALVVRRGKGERQQRMPVDERAELATGIATGAEDTDWNLIHI